MGRRQWHPTPGLLPGKSHGQRSLVGCSPWGHWGSDTTERLHFHFSLSCTGEGNGNPLHCSSWRIPGTEEPGGLPSMGSHRIGHEWSNLAAAAEHYDCLTRSVLLIKRDRAQGGGKQQKEKDIYSPFGEKGQTTLILILHICIFNPSYLKYLCNSLQAIRLHSLKYSK